MYISMEFANLTQFMRQGVLTPSKAQIHMKLGK